MNRERRCIRLVIDRKAVLLLSSVVVLVGAAGLLSSQQLSMTATYPIPAGVYNQIVTTGDSGGTPANTTLNRNAGNTILVPPGNAGGRVGIGTTAPASKLSVAGGLQLGDDNSACTASKAGTQRWRGGAMQVCSGAAWRAIAAAPIDVVADSGWVVQRAEATARCPAGTVISGGGVNCFAESSSGWISQSYPSSASTWRGACLNAANVLSDWVGPPSTLRARVLVHALCVRNP